MQFTEALFGDNKKLNGDPVVSQKTGIPPERCAKYRKYLSELHIGDTPAISKKQGGSVSNFPKEVIQNFINGGITHDPKVKGTFGQYPADFADPFKQTGQQR